MGTVPSFLASAKRTHVFTFQATCLNGLLLKEFVYIYVPTIGTIYIQLTLRAVRHLAPHGRDANACVQATSPIAKLRSSSRKLLRDSTRVSAFRHQFLGEPSPTSVESSDPQSRDCEPTSMARRLVQTGCRLGSYAPKTQHRSTRACEHPQKDICEHGDAYEVSRQLRAQAAREPVRLHRSLMVQQAVSKP